MYERISVRNIKILEDISLFCLATDTSFLDFCWCILWVSKAEWAVLFALGRGIHVAHYLRFTSGVTPDELLVASMAAGPILPHICDQALVWLEHEMYRTIGKCSTNWAMLRCIKFMHNSIGTQAEHVEANVYKNYNIEKEQTYDKKRKSYSYGSFQFNIVYPYS